MFSLSNRSLKLLEGVNPHLVRVVKKAIILSDVDFRVIEGVRTVERQKRLVEAGASRTMNSRHLTGHAVDLAAIVGGQIRWDWSLYHRIAQAMRAAANDEKVVIVWGGVWDRKLNTINDTEAEMDAYVMRMKELGKKPFLDGPHFELDRAVYK